MIAGKLQNVDVEILTCSKLMPERSSIKHSIRQYKQNQNPQRNKGKDSFFLHFLHGFNKPAKFSIIDFKFDRKRSP